MVRRATLGVFSMLLILVCVGFIPAANAQTATPSKAVITVSGIPAGTKSFAVEVTVDATVLKLGGVLSDSGGAAFSDGGSKGVGIFSDMDFPATVKLTVDLTGVTAGMSALSVGNVLDMLGTSGAAITGAMAADDIDLVTVASSTSSSSSSGSSTSGSGMLSADTITITINGQALNSTNGLNVTLAFGTNGVATVDTAGLTFTGMGAIQVLTEVKDNVLTAAWDGTITDAKVVLTAMLKAGTTGGTSTISVSKVEVAGKTDVTSSVASTVSPSSVTNSGGGTTSGGSFALIGPTSVTGPGKAAIAISASGVKKGQIVKLNGSTVTLSKDEKSGVAIVDLSKAMGSLALSLEVGKSMVDLGSLTVKAGTGTVPKVGAATANNKSSGASLKITGSGFTKTGTIVTLVPGSAVSVAKVTSMSISASPSKCIPSGSFVNVTTAGGTGAKKVKTHGSCG